MKHNRLEQRTAPPPRGFTLLELLVVMGIIVFLVTMTVAVVTSSITTSKEKATKATIRKVDGLLTDRMEAFTMGTAAQDLKGQNRQKVLDRKNLFKSGFPQTLVEAGVTVPSGDDPATQSSEAMYLFLTEMPSFGAPSVDTDAFSSSEIQDTDNDGLMEFVDAWGRPLRFYRWPTRLIRPAPAGSESTAQDYDSTSDMYTYPVKTTSYFGQTGHGAGVFFGSLPDASTLAKDPDDPMGWINPRTIDVADFEANFHTPDTWSMPLIVSVGYDGVLGLYEATETGNFGHLAQPKQADLDGINDNFTNRNLQR